MIDFTELKKKLTEFDEPMKKSADYIDGAEYQHLISAKTISQLLEIIEMQNNTASFLNQLIGRCAYGQNDIWGDKMESVYRSTGNILIQTESKLKQLGKRV